MRVPRIARKYQYASTRLRSAVIGRSRGRGAALIGGSRLAGPMNGASRLMDAGFRAIRARTLTMLARLPFAVRPGLTVNPRFSVAVASPRLARRKPPEFPLGSQPGEIR